MNTSIFSIDSKFMRMLSRFTDLVLLNLLFVVTSLPVVTIGPSAAALYSVVFNMGTIREDGVFRPYFRAFRENFRTAALVWLILFAACAALALDLVLIFNLGGVLEWMAVPVGILLVLEILAACMIFPLISLFRNTVMGTIKSGLILGLGNLPRAALTALLWMFPVLVALWMPAMLLSSMLAWLGLYFSAAAYGSSRLLRKVFAPYLPEDRFQKEEV